MKPPFADFREDILVGRDNTPLGEGLWAYRMDGNPGMRERAGLGGSLKCCDYLWVDSKGHILIEMTELWETVKFVGEEYNALKNNEETRRKFVRDRIRYENWLKAYGALLVLCRMNQWGENTGRVFWLVVSGDSADLRAVRNWDTEGKLGEEIREALMGSPEETEERKKKGPVIEALKGARLVSEVKVMTADILRKELSARIAP